MLRVDRAGRGRERIGATAMGREAVLECRGEVGRPTRSTAEGRPLEGRPARLEGERKVVLLLLPTESSLARPQGREEEVVLPFLKSTF